MAGTATDYNTAMITFNKKVLLWCEVAVPSASSRITLHTDGTPDSTANPSAVHLGHTEEGGCKVGAKGNFTDLFVDELVDPFASVVENNEAMISGSLAQILDMDILGLLSPGVGSVSKPTNIEQMTLGTIDVSYTPAAAIWLTNTSAKYAVFNLYKAKNNVGFEFDVGRKKKTVTPFAFKGYGISTRADVDQLGNFWKQV